MAKQNYSKKNFKKSNSKSYGRKPNASKGKTKPKFEEEEQVNSKNGNINDASYYYGDATVLDQVMNFSFNEFGGVVTDLFIDANGPGHIYNSMVATYWLNPSVPEVDPSFPNNNGSNIAGLRNFLTLSGSNAKTTLYAPQDVTVLMLALAEVIKVATFIARAFGIAYLFNYRNRTYPETLLRAMGIDPTNFADTLASQRIRFNQLLAVASRIPFPADIPLFRKASELYASLYLDDASSALAQTYMFCPYSTWKFNETYDANGAGLDTLQIVDPANLKSIGQVLNDFESMINALITSSSLNTIYSDVMRLAQAGKLGTMITFNSIPEDFVVVPTYNTEVRNWIHNAVIIGAPLATAQQHFSNNNTNLNDVSCDASANTIKYSPQFEVPNKLGSAFLVDFDHDGVTVSERVESTRLSARWFSLKDTNNKYYTTSTAFLDEYIVEATYYTGCTTAVDLTLTSSVITPSTLSSMSWISDVISKFDWAPLLYYLTTNDDVRVMGDLDYYTQLDQGLLSQIYDYEILHLLQIG